MNLKNIYLKLIIHIIELYLLIVFIFNFIACPRYVRTAGAKSLSVALRDRTFNLLLMDQMFHLCITQGVHVGGFVQCVFDDRRNF